MPSFNVLVRNTCDEAGVPEGQGLPVLGEKLKPGRQSFGFGGGGGGGGGGTPLTETLTDFETESSSLVQVSLYSEVLVGLTVWDPDVVLVPLQALDAVQLVVLVEDQDNVLEDP